MTDRNCFGLTFRAARATRVMVAFLYGILITYSASLAAKAPPQILPPTVSYAHVADLVTAGTTVARIKVKSVNVVPAERAPGLTADRVRFYVEAETLGLIRGETVVGRKIAFLIDGPAARARRPGLKGRTLLVFGKVGSRVDQLQLSSSGAMIEWSQTNEAIVRKVIADLLAPDAPPAITGITSAFHVAGAILGEGETQIFLQTVDGTPISLSILRRPDEQPQFSASLGEIVDDAASLPAADTLLWYRLACSLPDRLPSRALRAMDRASSAAATRDYAAFREALAPCERGAVPIL